MYSPLLVFIAFFENLNEFYFSIPMTGKDKHSIKVERRCASVQL